MNEFVLHRNVECCDIVVIDEISMLSSKLFTQYFSFFAKNPGFRNVYGNKVRTVFVGDLLQIPCVDKNGDTPVYCSPYWNLLRWIYLRQVHRQKDENFLKALGQLRLGIISKELQDIVAERQLVETAMELPVLTPLRKTTEAINEYKLEKLDGEKYCFNWKFTKVLDSKVDEDYAAKSARFSRYLVLKEGARVMLLTNSEHWVNGSLGTFCGTRVAEVPIFNIETGALKEHVNQRVLMVLLDQTKSIVNVPLQNEEFYNGRRELDCYVTQYPIMLAWAMTIHKAQGLTLECARLDLAGHFASGQTYVGFSRVRERSGLFLRGNLEKCTVDSAAIQIYDSKGYGA